MVGEKIAEKELVKETVVIILVAHPSASTNFRERLLGNVDLSVATSR